MSVLLSLLTIFFTWRKTSNQREGVLATAAFAATYWITQATAIAYPNTAFFDPEFLTPYSFRLGLPTQAYFEIGFLSVITLASWLALRKSAHFWLPQRDMTFVDVRLYGKKVLTIDHHDYSVNLSVALDGSIEKTQSLRF